MRNLGMCMVLFASSLFSLVALGQSVEVNGGQVKVSGPGAPLVNVQGGSISSDPNQTGVTSSTISKGKTVTYDGVGRKFTLTCNATNGVSAVVNGTSLSITMKGVCQNLEVNGSMNTVNVEQIAKIAVNGVQNKVSWKKSTTGSKPVIAVTGVNNRVSQVK